MKKLNMKKAARYAGGRGGLEAVPKEVTGAALAAAIGGGVGASYAIEAAGGLAKLGSAGVGVVSAGTTGLYASWVAGFAVGSYLYEHSETVRDFAQQVVGAVVESLDDMSNGGGGGRGVIQQTAVDVWEAGFVPSNAGRTVRRAGAVPTDFQNFWRTV